MYNYPTPPEIEALATQLTCQVETRGFFNKTPFQFSTELVRSALPKYLKNNLLGRAVSKKISTKLGVGAPNQIVCILESEYGYSGVRDYITAHLLTPPTLLPLAEEANRVSTLMHQTLIRGSSSGNLQVRTHLSLGEGKGEWLCEQIEQQLAEKNGVPGILFGCTIEFQEHDRGQGGDYYVVAYPLLSAPPVIQPRTAPSAAAATMVEWTCPRCKMSEASGAIQAVVEPCKHIFCTSCAALLPNTRCFSCRERVTSYARRLAPPVAAAAAGAGAGVAAAAACPICLATAAEIQGKAALLPCGHTFCRGCAPSFVEKTCPSCRANVTGTLNIF